VREFSVILCYKVRIRNTNNNGDNNNSNNNNNNKKEEGGKKKERKKERKNYFRMQNADAMNEYVQAIRKMCSPHVPEKQHREEQRKLQVKKEDFMKINVNKSDA
jgi:hypothetical protein